MNELQRSIATKYANADAVKIVTDAEVWPLDALHQISRRSILGSCAQALIDRPVADTLRHTLPMRCVVSLRRQGGCTCSMPRDT